MFHGFEWTKDSYSLTAKMFHSLLLFWHMFVSQKLTNLKHLYHSLWVCFPFSPTFLLSCFFTFKNDAWVKQTRFGPNYSFIHYSLPVCLLKTWVEPFSTRANYVIDAWVNVWKTFISSNTTWYRKYFSIKRLCCK